MFGPGSIFPADPYELSVALTKLRLCVSESERRFIDSTIHGVDICVIRHCDIGEVVCDGRFRFFNGDFGIFIASYPDRLRVGSDLISRFTETYKLSPNRMGTRRSR